MKKLIIIIFCCSFLGSSAQISGYMGKKFSIMYSPSIGFPHLSASADGNSIVPNPTFHNALKFEYIIANHTAIGARYKFGYNTAPNATRFNSYEGFKKRHTFMSHTYGAYIKFFRKKLLAPIGSYFALGVNFQNIILDNLILEEESYGSSTTNDVSKANYSAFDLGFSAAVGNNWIFGNSFIFGFEVEFMPTLLSIRNAAEITGGRNVNEPSNAVINKMNLTSEILKLSLNIGFLAF